MPTFYTSPQITSTSKAVIAGSALLTQSVGRPAAIDFSAIPNPALEPFDVVYADAGPGSELHVIDEITIPLTPANPLTATTRTSVSSSFEAS